MKRLCTVLALTFVACAPATESDAVLHIRIRVPYEEGDRPLALVQVNRDEDRFAFDENVWATPKPFEVDLRKEQDPVIELAVRTDDPTAESSQHLRVRIAFCDPQGSKPCSTDPDTPELAFFIEHPFYPGELTEWNAGPRGDEDFHMRDSEVPSHQRDFPRLGEPANVIKACSVAGCLQVADQPGASFTIDPDDGYCRKDRQGDPVHFCAEDS